MISNPIFVDAIAFLLWSLAIIPAPTSPPAAIPPPVEQVSANCSAPTYASDRLVCSDPELHALDQEMAKLVSRLGAQVLEPAGPAVESQSAWFKRRSMCAFDRDQRDCLIKSYTQRLRILKSLENGRN